MIEVGKKYYVMAHAYHHYIGEVTEVTPRSVVLNNVIKVHSCSRSWSQFFKDGIGNDTSYDIFLDGAEVPYSLGIIPWPHPIPKEQNVRNRR